MSTKKRVSLEAQLAGQMSQPAEAEQGVENVVAFNPASAKATPEKATVYLPKPAMKRIKQMALDQDKRINDLLQEGIDMMLKSYGQPTLKEFEAK